MTLVPKDAAAAETSAKSAVKLPMAARKSSKIGPLQGFTGVMLLTCIPVRDNFESKLEEFNARLSDALGVSWKVSIDTGLVWSHAEKDGYAQHNMGGLLSEIIDSAIRNVANLSEKYGEDGRRELNTIASQHVMTVEPGEELTPYNGCDFEQGKLRVLFKPEYLATNVDQGCYYLPDMLSKAGEGAAGAKGMSLQARYSVEAVYNLEVEELLSKARTALAMPSLEFTPNFDSNYAKVAEYDAQNPGELADNWKQAFGETSIEYFRGFVWRVGSEFKDDDMLQEGFADSVAASEVALRVVDGLKSATYNEPTIEDGVLYMSTLAKFWRTNTDEASNKIVDLL